MAERQLHRDRWARQRALPKERAHELLEWHIRARERVPVELA